MVERTRGHAQRRRSRLPAVVPGHRVGADDGRGAACTGAGPIRADREGRARGDITERVVRRVEALGRVRPRAPAVIDALEGLTTMWSRTAAVTCDEAVPVLPEQRAGDRVGARSVAVQLAPEQDPFGRDRERRRRRHVPERVVRTGRTPSAVYACEPPGADDRRGRADRDMVERPRRTFNVAVPVLPAVPVTVWPRSRRGAVAPVQDPFGRDRERRAPRSRHRASCRMVAAFGRVACEPPAAMVAEAGDNTRWSSGPAVTFNDAVPVLPPVLPVTVWAPAAVAVQLCPCRTRSGRSRRSCST